LKGRKGLKKGEMRIYINQKRQKMGERERHGETKKSVGKICA